MTITIINHRADTYGGDVFKVVTLDAEGRLLRLSDQTLQLLKDRIASYIAVHPNLPFESGEEPAEALNDGLPQAIDDRQDKQRDTWKRVSRFWSGAEEQSGFVKPAEYNERCYTKKLRELAYELVKSPDRNWSYLRKEVNKVGAALGKTPADIAQDLQASRRAAEKKKDVRILKVRIRSLNSEYGMSSKSDIDRYFTHVEEILTKYPKLRDSVSLPDRQDVYRRSYRAKVDGAGPLSFSYIIIEPELIELGVAAGNSDVDVRVELAGKVVTLFMQDVERSGVATMHCRSALSAFRVLGREAIDEVAGKGEIISYLEQRQSELPNSYHEDELEAIKALLRFLTE